MKLMWQLCFVEIYSVNVVEKNPVLKSQTKPFYIGTKEAPSVYVTFRNFNNM